MYVTKNMLYIAHTAVWYFVWSDTMRCTCYELWFKMTEPQIWIRLQKRRRRISSKVQDYRHPLYLSTPCTILKIARKEKSMNLRWNNCSLEKFCSTWNKTSLVDMYCWILTLILILERNFSFNYRAFLFWQFTLLVLM